MSGCRECFEAGGLGGRDLQICIDEKFPNFQCEQEAISGFSPGKVEDTEELAFLLTHPNFFDVEKWTIVPTAFEELTRTDLSFFRSSHSTDQEIRSVIDLKIERARKANPNDPRAIEYVALADVAEIRAQTDGKGRTLGAYDTAYEDNRGHASLFTRKDVLADKKLKGDIKATVHRIVSKKIKLLETYLTERSAHTVKSDDDATPTD